MARLTGLAPVLLVPEVQEALDWYRDKLGFDVEGYEPAPATYGYARRDGCNVHVSHGEPARPNHEIVEPDLFDVYLWTDDVRALHRELVDRGADLLHAPIERPWGTLEIRVQDPFGYILAFGQPL
jgi:catechol 2,3-dioxygenase-like lactoylglutathione lyase family enzyme